MEVFSFLVTPAMRLIYVINSLIEIHFDSPRNVRMDVGVGGFEITMYDKRLDDGIPNEVFKTISVDAASFTEFNCQVPVSRMIAFDDIIQLLEPVDYYDGLRFFSDGTTLSVASVYADGDANLEGSANFLNIALTPKLPTVTAFEVEHKVNLVHLMTKLGRGTDHDFAQVWLKDGKYWIMSPKYNKSRASSDAFVSYQAWREIYFVFIACTNMVREFDLKRSRFYIVRDPGDYIMLRNSLKGFGEFIMLQKLNDTFVTNPPSPTLLENFAPRT